MRHAIPTLVPLLLVLGCDRSPLAPSGDLPAIQAGVGQAVHRVTVGGPDLCTGVGGGPGCDANFSLVALQYSDGSVSGQWHDQYAQPFGGTHVRVNCVVVVGNDAWISGVGPDHGFGGNEWTTMVRDNGRSQADPPDQITFGVPSVFVGDCNARHDFEGDGFLFDVPQGQVVVR